MNDRQLSVNHPVRRKGRAGAAGRALPRAGARWLLAWWCAVVCAFATSAAHADCLTEAAVQHRVNPHVLRAILWHESRFNPKARNHNTNGTRDIGMAQINSTHLPLLARYGVGEAALYQPCTSIAVAAWLLGGHMARHGNTWFAVGAYHSLTPQHNQRYATTIQAILRTWNVAALTQ